jgi:site-specific recombinase XerD
MAMDLLQAGVDRSVIALRLGHESVETTQIYLEATEDINSDKIDCSGSFGAGGTGRK